jgi:hypothetical protein
MSDIPGSKERPVWVRIGLLGTRSRRSAWICVGVSLAIAIGAVVLGLADRRLFLGSLALLPFMLVSALGYYCAIRWVDRNGSWS